MESPPGLPLAEWDTRGGSAKLANAVGWAAHAHMCTRGVPAHTRLLPQDWVVVMRRLGVCRVRRWVCVCVLRADGTRHADGAR
eukprot:6377698-Prymnesium_polylepis.1